MPTPREVSESYWAAECRRDIDGVMSYYLPDATYEEPGHVHTGHAAIRKAYEDSARDYPALEVRIVRGSMKARSAPRRSSTRSSSTPRDGASGCAA